MSGASAACCEKTRGDQRWRDGDVSSGLTWTHDWEGRLYIGKEAASGKFIRRLWPSTGVVLVFSMAT